MRGVQLFFLATALTLMMSWRSGSNGVVYFYLRRLFRITPLFWLAVVVYTTLGGWWGHWHLWLPAALFVHRFHPDLLWNGPVSGGWSIATEMAFYLIFPLLALTIRGGATAVLFFILTLAFDLVFGCRITSLLEISVSPDLKQEVRDTGWLWLPSELPVFAAGFVAYYAVQWRKPALWLSVLLSVLAVALFLLIALGHQRVNIWGPIFGLLVYAMSSGRVWALDNPVTRAVGRVSYGIYPCHFLVLYLLGKFLLGALPWLSILWLLPVGLALSFVVASVLHVVIEEPARRLGKWIIETRPYRLVMRRLRRDANSY